MKNTSQFSHKLYSFNYTKKEEKLHSAIFDCLPISTHYFFKKLQKLTFLIWQLQCHILPTSFKLWPICYDRYDTQVTLKNVQKLIKLTFFDSYMKKSSSNMFRQLWNWRWACGKGDQPIRKDCLVVKKNFNKCIF